jgi:DGQHR domain-containing protein
LTNNIGQGAYSGFTSTQDFPAYRSKRSGKYVYTFGLSIRLLTEVCPIPEPQTPFVDNRRIDESRAKAFGKYWAANPAEWAVPPLLLDTAQNFEFHEDQVVTGTEIVLGRLRLPRDSRDVIRILDGQHRVRGWYLQKRELADSKEKVSAQLHTLKESGNQVEIQAKSKEMNSINNNIDRLDNEFITIELIAGVSAQEHKDFFVTINNMAKGVNKNEVARMDETLMTNRVAKVLADSVPLLQNKIDDRSASVRGSSEYYISLINVADIVRHVCYGIQGKNKKGDYDQRAEEFSAKFFEIISENSSDLESLANNAMTPKELRNKSLWGSLTILRCLAGAFFKLAVVSKDNQSEEAFRVEQESELNETGVMKFRKLINNLETTKAMEIIGKGKDKKLVSEWYDTSVVMAGALSPSSRNQDLTKLAELFAAWAESGEIFKPKKI